uniref:FUZ/MON1/HPS1 first Longin domain-containing protein n=1 Tax=Ciona savignyi TaxID=51511 RepID=H2Z6H7_CIOSA
MAEHILCVTASGGIPLLTRTKPGDCMCCSPLSFPVVGALNGVHMFASNRDVNLLSTISENHRIVFYVYSSGLEELTNIRNVDRLKKDLRSCYNLIDTFLDHGSNKKHLQLEMFGDLTQCVDVVLHEDSKLLEEHLSAFVEAAQSTYGCLVNDGRVVCATPKWWHLTGLELALLGRLIGTLSSSVTSCDIPIYLPHSSPNIPHRLLVFTLVSGVGAKSGVRACVLCGPEPSLTQVQDTLV